MALRVHALARSPVAICAYAPRMPFWRASEYFALSTSGFGPPGFFGGGAFTPSASPAVTYTDVIGRPERSDWPVSGFMKNRSSSGWAMTCITEPLAGRTGPEGAAAGVAEALWPGVSEPSVSDIASSA